MSGDIEAAGALVTAGLAAQALDRPESAGRHEAPNACLNCGAMLQGAFCHVCGQSAHVHRTLGHVVEEVAHGVMHFDTRAWRTLPMLAFRPGTLTRAYIDGRRARYIAPMTLFLLVVFVMFFVFALLGGAGAPAAADAGRGVAALTRELAATDAAIARLRAQAGGAPAAIDPGLMAQRARLAEELDAAKARTALRARAAAQLAADMARAEAADDADEIAALRFRQALLERAEAADGAPVPALSLTQGADGRIEVGGSADLASPDDRTLIFDQIRRAAADGRIVVNSGVPAWDKKIKAKLSDPEFAWYKIQNTAYKFAWLLVPLSLPFVAVLFLWKRGVTFYDHAVFVLYSLSFMCFLALALVTLGRVWPAGADAAGSAAALGVPAHMFFQLKGGYGLRVWSALWRTALLLLFAAICLGLFVLAIVLLGLVG